MNRLVIVIVLASLLAFVGCNKDKTADPADKPPVPNVVGNSGKSGLVVPDSLKSAAYSYLGLDELKSLTYDVSTGLDLPPTEMIQTIALTSVEGDKATFEVKRISSIPNMGDQTIELNPDGVFTLKVTMGTLSKPALELPSDVAVGKEWTSSMELTSASQSLEVTAKSKATKIEKVKVKAGEFECIRIESTVKTKSTMAGSSDVNSSSGSIVTFYAQGIGLVKLDLKGKMADGSDSNMRYELTKIEG